MSDEKTTLINYDGANQHTLSAGPKDIVRLNPGINTINAALWGRVVAAAKKEKNPQGGVLFLMEEGIVSEVDAGKNGAADLSSMNVKKATEAVQTVMNLDDLLAMLDVEEEGKNRAGVVKAIKEQIISLEEAAAKKEDSDEGDE